MEPDLVRSLLEEARAKQKALAGSGVGEATRQWSSPLQMGAGAQPAGRGNPLSSVPIPPPRLRRKDRSHPRPTEPSLEMASSKCQPDTPATSLCLADSPGQHRVMPPGPASRANVSAFCFLTAPGSGTEGAWNGLQWPFCFLPLPLFLFSLSLTLSHRLIADSGTIVWTGTQAYAWQSQGLTCQLPSLLPSPLCAAAPTLRTPRGA